MDIKDKDHLKKLIAISLVLILSLMVVLTITAMGQEEEPEQVPLSHHTSLFLTSGMELVPSKADVTSGSVGTTDLRLITGGGSEQLGTWEATPVISPLSIGGSSSLNLQVQGTGSAISFTARIYLNGEEAASGTSRERNLISATDTFDISMNMERVELEEGDTVSVEVWFSAGMSRGVELLFEPTQASALIFSSSPAPMEVEVHPHGDHMDVMAGITLPWGVESFVSALATLSGEDEMVEREADNVEETEGRLDILWEFGILPQGDLLLNVEVTDASGNVHSQQQEVHPDDHDHDHGGIMITSGSLWLLAVVVGGVFGVGYLGGIMPLFSFFDNRKMRYLLAFSAGVFIATALFHALPDAIEMMGWWALGGVVLGFATLYSIEHFFIKIIDRIFKKKGGEGHKHGHEGVKLHLHDHHSGDHEIITDGDVCDTPACDHHLNQSSQAAFFGVSLHNFIEGIVITTLFMNPDTQAIGLIVILATILHKAPCTFSIASLLKMGGYSPSSVRKRVLILLGMMPLGAVLSLLLLMNISGNLIAFGLAFSAGTFLEIGLLDLLPESVRDKKGRWLAVAAIAGGFALLWLFSLIHAH
ncbi:MAG: ZIP family metal transporter [Thermoplasmata archaeon]|nr:ZIP family metal transporter [Thermoplasmata archaeon]